MNWNKFFESVAAITMLLLFILVATWMANKFGMLPKPVGRIPELNQETKKP